MTCGGSIRSLRRLPGGFIGTLKRLGRWGLRALCRNRSAQVPEWTKGSDVFLKALACGGSNPLPARVMWCMLLARLKRNQAPVLGRLS